MGLILDEFRIDGAKLDPDVTDRVTGARLVGRDKATMSLELSIWDGDGLLMREGKLASSRVPSRTPFKRASWARYGEARLILDGILFRLADVDQALGSPVVRLTFDDEAAALLRRHTRAIVTSRGSKTRAETIGMAVDRVKEIAVPYRCPEEGIKQNIEAVDVEDADGKGFADGARLTIKGAKADREQLANIAKALEVADALQAGERATLALIAAGIAESLWRNLTGGDRDSQGVLQVRLSTAKGIVPRTLKDPRTPAQAVPGLGAVTRDPSGPIAAGTLDPRDIKQVARAFLLRGFYAPPRDGKLMGAIERAAKEPELPIEQLAQSTQGSGFADGSNYAPWVEEAKEILDAWGGVGQTTVLRESFGFQIGGKLDPEDQKAENYMAGTNRLGNELDGWSFWLWRNRANFVSDEWAFKRKPVLRIGPEHVYAAHRGPDDGLKPFWQVGYRAASGSAIQEVRFAGPSRRWDFAPLSVVQIEDMGPMSGRWLISEHDYDLQRDWLTATIRRPMEKQPEPAPRVRTVTTTETREQESGSPRDRILSAARKALSATWKPFYKYSMTRPYPETLFPATAGPHVILVDCSSFVTLVYKAAGIVDPNKLGYNGTGNTSTLRANGKKTNDPQPGDLVHYGTGAAGGASHVGIYSGNGKVIQIGGSAGVTELDVHYRSDFAGYFQHDLADA